MSKILPLKNSQPSAAIKKKPEQFLLHDPGGEARWPVLKEHIQTTLRKGQGIIFLVPDIYHLKFVEEQLKMITAQEISILDKKLKDQEEFDSWIKLREGRSRIVLGTRSAVFAPVDQLGLIVIYDEENRSFEQEQSPFYHARQVSLMRSKLEGCRLLLVSSAPSIESWMLAKKRKLN